MVRTSIGEECPFGFGTTIAPVIIASRTARCNQGDPAISGIPVLRGEQGEYDRASYTYMDFDATTPDGTLIAAAQAGDKEAFAHLVRRYQGPLVKVALSRLSRPTLAEEAVQEAFLCAHKWLHTYDSRYSFRTWLWTILLNQCKRIGQREARHGERSAVMHQTPHGIDPVCTQRLPLEELLAREDGRQVHELLARLPEAQADALRLRFFGGLSFPEIAAAMQVSESGAKHRVKVGLLTLAGWLNEPAASGGSRRTASGE
jgi:RNA polymerase sigma-70 factor, ECF subfamily